jgi:hypothetical protein
MLEKGAGNQRDVWGCAIWRALAAAAAVCEVRVVFVYAHCGTPRNEEVDAFVNAQAQSVHRTTAPSSGHWERDLVRTFARANTSEMALGGRPRASGEVRLEDLRLPWELEKRVVPARVGVLGWGSLGLIASRPDLCPWCGERALGREGSAVDHVFTCAAFAAEVPHGLSSVSLWTRPEEAGRTLLAFLRRCSKEPHRVAEVAVAPSGTSLPRRTRVTR